MTPSPRPPHRRRAALAAAAAVLLATAAVPDAARAQGAGRGFLFHEPAGSVTLRGGFARANARSDIFAFTTDELTLGRGDFDAGTYGADLAVRVAPRTDLMFGFAYAGTTARSESRGYIGTDDLPIEQRTTFRRIPLTAGARAYLTPRGRSVGQYAWVPARTAFYVGGGAGLTWYSFRQKGDFVDAETLDIFGDEFSSSGWTRQLQALGGVDVSLGSYFAITAEGRHAWARAPMDDDDFEGFDRIDLSGFTATVGLTIRV